MSVLAVKFPVTISTKMNNKALSIGYLSVLAFVYVVKLYVSPPLTHEAFFLSVSLDYAFHNAFILSISSGVSVVMPSSFASLITPSKSRAICAESISELPTSLI